MLGRVEAFLFAQKVGDHLGDLGRVSFARSAFSGFAFPARRPGFARRRLFGLRQLHLVRVLLLLLFRRRQARGVQRRAGDGVFVARAVRHRPFADLVARLVAALETGGDVASEHLHLDGGVDCVAVGPSELQIVVSEQFLDDMVHEVLDPLLQRNKTFLRRLHALRLGRSAVCLRDKWSRRDGEGVADEPSQPLVIFVLQRRLARGFVLEIRRHEPDAGLRLRVALHKTVEIVLKFLDLVNRPLFRQRAEAIGDCAGSVVFKVRDFSTQGNVDCHYDLLDRRVAVDARGAHVARQV